MTLQSSGAISQANLQTEYGGANPISASEYYRGGAYVNTTRTTTVTNYTSWYYNTGNPLYGIQSAYVWFDGASYYVSWKWSHSEIYTHNYPAGKSPSTYTTGGYTYWNGAFYGYYYNPNAAIRRSWNSTSTVNVNTTVPSSGTISLSQYYGQGN